MFIYLDKEKAKKGITQVLMVGDTRVEDYDKYFEGNAVEFEGETLPSSIIYANGEVKEPTIYDKYMLGKYTLAPNEYVDHSTKQVLIAPNPPIEMAKPVFDSSTKQWKETGDWVEVITRKRQLLEGELSNTNKFEFQTYRKLVEEDGNDIGEIDRYREYLIREKQSLDKPRAMTLQKVNRPNWVDNY